jgi:mono/diheme cytochrome c family protein
MRTLFGMLATLAVALTFGGRLLAADAAQIEKGKGVFKAQKCSMCHAIAGVGNKKAPLDGVGAKLKADDIRKWIVTPQEMKADVKKKGFDKLEKADLDALVAYMESLK